MRRGKIGTRIAAGALALGLVLSLSPAPGALAAGSSQPSSWAAAEVERAREAGLLDFNPQSGYQENITRGEFAALAVQLARTLGCPVGQLKYDDWQGTPFTDLTEGTDGVYSAAAWRLGLMNGVSDTAFAPERTITRMEICVLLSRVMDVCGVALPQTVPGVAERIASGAEGTVPDWAVEGVENLIGSGLMQGSGDSWQLSAYTTLEQAAMLAVRAMDAGQAELAETLFTQAEREKIARLNELRAAFGNPGEPYAQTPSVEEFIPGALNGAFLQDGLNAVNYVRAIAGLSPVALNPEKNDLAQAGALLLAAGEFSHTPSRPAGMPNALYQKGYQATSTSNIGQGYRNLWEFTLSCADDAGESTLGHRRWLLNPSLTTIGMGYVEGSVTTVVTGGSTDAAGHDLVTWPSEGVFPAELVGSSTVWSCTPDPDKYDVSGSSLTVTVTDNHGGRCVLGESAPAYGRLLPQVGAVWLPPIDQDTSQVTVETGGYGSGPAILFTPSQVSLEPLTVLTVEIAGLRLRSGGTETVTYTVKLF